LAAVQLGSSKSNQTLVRESIKEILHPDLFKNEVSRLEYQQVQSTPVSRRERPFLGDSSLDQQDIEDQQIELIKNIKQIVQ
jgi:hypothetical protein